jgi:hypothetical protein
MGFPVKVSGTAKTKPTRDRHRRSKASAMLPAHRRERQRTASNTGNTITFSKQKFTGASGGNALCPTSAKFSATFGPVIDSSVTGSPKVFVN